MNTGSNPEAVLDGGRSSDPAVNDATYSELLSLTMIFVRALMGRKLRDHRESADVCQSVVASLADDLRAGRVRFESQAALAGYLHRVVTTKLAMLARHDGAAKRQGEPGGRGGDVSAIEGHAWIGETPSVAVRADEAHARLLGGLNEQEQELLRLRMAGWSWEKLAAHTGRDAAAMRQQFSRLQRRVLNELDSLGGE